MTFVLTALSAALACGVELLEALAIVLAVGVARRPRDAVYGGVAALVVCAGLAVVVGPVLLAHVALEPLRLVIGTALLLFGLEWLRKAILRLAGQRAPASSYQEFLEERAALEAADAPTSGADWPARITAFKGVLLEGIEVILIVSALAARPAGAAPALTGAGAAVLAVALIGITLHRPLRKLPETQLKYAVGLLLTAFGTFFAAEGLGAHWPLGDASLPGLILVLLFASQAMIAALGRAPAKPEGIRR